MPSPPSVAVVTDSTVYLPTGFAERYSVRVVPLQVTVGGRTGAEGGDISPAEVAAALRGGRLPVTTSRPAPQAFATAYPEARALGATAVVSLHLSGELSGTVESARLGAQAVRGLDVRVVDSRSLAMGLGFAVLAAAQWAMAGGHVDAVVDAAETARTRTSVLARRGHARTPGAQGSDRRGGWLDGTALTVKPILSVVDGRLVPLDKVRTTSRAVARLQQLTVAAEAGGPVDVAVQHLAASDRAATLAGELRLRLPGLRELYCSEVGAVVAAHAGPGLLGVAVRRR